MFKSTKAILVLIFVFTAVSLACSNLSLPSIAPQPTATPAPVSTGDMLVFNKIVPPFSTSLSPGEKIAGAPMQYIGKTADGGYEVSIEGVKTVKRAGDSFIWSGIIAPGTHGQFNLRITAEVLGGLPVAGPATITILNPKPFQLDDIPIHPDALQFTNIILLDSNIPVGDPILGTTLIFRGTSQRGNIDVAEIGTGAEFSYYLAGDSIVWRGKLRDNIFVQYDLRIVSFNESSLFLTGEANLYIEQNRLNVTE